MVPDVIDTVDPAVTATVFMIRSALEVPTVPWAMTVPPVWVLIRKQDAVPVASAEVSEVIAANVARPAVPVSLYPENAVAEQVMDASRVRPAADASALAGTVPA